MGLAVRIIPTLLMRGDELVKGRQFRSWRKVGHVAQAMQIYQGRSVDETILLDIGATPAKRAPDFARIHQMTGGFFTPITIGGGVRSVEHGREILNCGADKFSIGTACCHVPDLVRRCADHFGSQAVVVSVDVGFDGTVMIECGRAPWNNDPLAYAEWAQDCGAGEILLTSIDREGTMQGYDLALIERVSKNLDIPVVAHGGCSGYPDMLDAIKAGASAVAAGALFQFTDATPREAALWLAEQGVETRIPS